MKSIEVKNPEINQSHLEEQLATILAKIPDNLNLSTSGPNVLHRDYLQQDSAAEVIQSLIKFIPETTLKEGEFKSEAPLIGPIIVMIRKAWNWMSTRWYVLPILIQQSTINSELVIYLIKSAQAQEKQAEHIMQLEKRIAELEQKRPFDKDN